MYKTGDVSMMIYAQIDVCKRYLRGLSCDKGRRELDLATNASAQVMIPASTRRRIIIPENSAIVLVPIH